MKSFQLTPDMLTTFGGVFYPTGHIFMMFANLDDAHQAAQALVAQGIQDDTISLVTPEAILNDIGDTVRGDDLELPSVGTEAATAKLFMKLALEGQHALLVHAPSVKETEQVMAILKNAPITHAEKYRQLIIEDIR